jgi:guanylate kinase
MTLGERPKVHRQMKKRPPRGRIFVVSAPSGCGKTTLCRRLLADGLDLADSVSMTTRPPRPGEKEGADYLFVTERRFRRMISEGGFLEHEKNFGNYYGTPRAFVEKNLGRGRPVLLSIDVKGAMKVRRAFPAESVLIFLVPPSIRALKERLVSRRADAADVIKRRLALAKRELSYKKRYDYSIVNDDLDKAYRELKSVVIENMNTAALPEK